MPSIHTTSFFLSTVILLGACSDQPEDTEMSFEPEDTEMSFESIIALPTCSSSLVAFDDAKKTDRAIGLTNGHCITFVPYGDAISNYSLKENIETTLQLGFETFVFDKDNKSFQLSPNKLLYATLSGTDLALIEFDETYEDIEEKFGIAPLVLSRSGPKSGDRVTIKSGYFEESKTCVVDGIATMLLEARWTWDNSIRYDCDARSGYSGAPLVSLETGKVVGVHNTGDSNNDENCSLSNPCELDAQGAITEIAEAGWNYSQQTNVLYSCRGADGILNFDVDSCFLPAPCNDANSLECE